MPIDRHILYRSQRSCWIRSTLYPQAIDTATTQPAYTISQGFPRLYRCPTARSYDVGEQRSQTNVSLESQRHIDAGHRHGLFCPEIKRASIEVAIVADFGANHDDIVKLMAQPEAAAVVVACEA